MSVVTRISLQDLERSSPAYASEIDSDWLKEVLIEDPQCEQELTQQAA